MRKPRAFTFVEIMACVAILAVAVTSTLIFYFASISTSTKATADKVVLKYLNECLDEYRVYGGMTAAHSLGGANSQAKIDAVIAALKAGITLNGMLIHFVHPGYTPTLTGITCAGSGKNFYFKGYTSQ